MSEENNLVLVRQYTDPMEAKLVRTRLESDGIYCFLQSEQTSQIMPLHVMAIKVGLFVRKADEKKTIEILTELEELSKKKD